MLVEATRGVLVGYGLEISDHNCLAVSVLKTQAVLRPQVTGARQTMVFYGPIWGLWTRMSVLILKVPVPRMMCEREQAEFTFTLFVGYSRSQLGGVLI